MWNCYLEIFRVIHFFVCTLSWTGIWNLITLMWRQSFTRTLIFIDNWYNGDGLENSFWPPTPTGVRLETGTCRPLVDTELLLLWAHWLPARTIQSCFCVIAKWNCRAQQPCLCFQKDKSIYSREMKTHNYEEQTMAAWLVMVRALKSCRLSQITFQSAVCFLKEEAEN